MLLRTLASQIVDPGRAATPCPDDPQGARDRVARALGGEIVDLLKEALERAFNPTSGLFSRPDPSFRGHPVHLLRYNPQWRAPALLNDDSLADRASYTLLPETPRDFDGDWARLAESTNQRLRAANAGVEVIAVTIHPTGGYAVIFHAPEISAAKGLP